MNRKARRAAAARARPTLPVVNIDLSASMTVQPIAAPAIVQRLVSDDHPWETVRPFVVWQAPHDEDAVASAWATLSRRDQETLLRFGRDGLVLQFTSHRTAAHEVEPGVWLENQRFLFMPRKVS